MIRLVHWDSFGPIHIQGDMYQSNTAFSFELQYLIGHLYHESFHTNVQFSLFNVKFVRAII